MKQVMSRYFYVWIFLVAVFIPYCSQAASLYIDPASSHLYRGDSIVLSVRVDVDEEEGECVNAVDAILTYSDNIEPVDFSIGDSIMNVWVEQPTIDKENHQITFAGGVPNGYCGRIIGDPRLTNIVAQIVFKSPGFTIGSKSSANQALVDFAGNTSVYLNDGRGTKADLSTYPARITLDDQVGDTLVNEWKEEVDADNINPEKFSIALQRDEKAFSQKYYIVFNTSDKQTGIDHYEVMEEPMSQFAAFQWGRADAPWVETRSPYVLKDQSLNSIIRVKAVDKAGNEYISNLIPDESQRTMSFAQMSLIFVLVTTFFFVVAIAWFVVRKVIVSRRKKMEKVEGATSEVVSDEMEGSEKTDEIEGYEDNEEKYE